jgi:hypothetical protein
MKGIIDRFEGDFAVVEIDNGEIKNILKSKLPSDVEEGMVINIGSKITIDYKETEKRQKEIKELCKDIWQE